MYCDARVRGLWHTLFAPHCLARSAGAMSYGPGRPALGTVTYQSPMPTYQQPMATTAYPGTFQYVSTAAPQYTTANAPTMYNLPTVPSMVPGQPAPAAAVGYGPPAVSPTPTQPSMVPQATAPPGKAPGSALGSGKGKKKKKSNSPCC